MSHGFKGPLNPDDGHRYNSDKGTIPRPEYGRPGGYARRTEQLSTADTALNPSSDGGCPPGPGSAPSIENTSGSGSTVDKSSTNKETDTDRASHRSESSKKEATSRQHKEQQDNKSGRPRSSRRSKKQAYHGQSDVPDELPCSRQDCNQMVPFSKARSLKPEEVLCETCRRKMLGGKH